MAILEADKIALTMPHAQAEIFMPRTFAGEPKTALNTFTWCMPCSDESRCGTRCGIVCLHMSMHAVEAARKAKQLFTERVNRGPPGAPHQHCYK